MLDRLQVTWKMHGMVLNVHSPCRTLACHRQRRAPELLMLSKSDVST